MKRSEAVKKIVEIINYHDGGSIESYVADRLLEVLVDGFGMLPPEIEISRGPFETYICEWEPEDD